MASLTYVILDHHIKANKTVRIKFRLEHNRKQAYCSSIFEANIDQLKKVPKQKMYLIKDPVLLNNVNKELSKFNDRLFSFKMIDGFTASELLKLITTDIDKNAEIGQIDFIKFGKQYLKQLEIDGRDGMARNIRPMLNNLIDFHKDETLDVNEITSNFLRDFERYLSRPHKIVRMDQFGRKRATQSKGLDKGGIAGNMNHFRLLFNACRKNYNTEFITKISHYPFEFYKIPKKPIPHKRGEDLSIVDLIAFRDADLTGRQAMSRDLFMLSFYLCGMNAKDIFSQEWNLKNNRIGYERSKTKGKRQDNAFISLNVPDVAIPLIEKYSSKWFSNKYSGYESFIRSLSRGMPDGITFYHARHTFATWAYNKCGFSKDHVAMALNHSSNRVTESYIATDWSIIDKVQEGVLSLIAADQPV